MNLNRCRLQGTWGTVRSFGVSTQRQVFNPIGSWKCAELALISIVCLAWTFCGVLTVQAADTPSADDVAHFEQHVRPILVEHCHGCHGAKKQEGGLRLDSREASLKGGASGVVITPGKPSESLLIEAISHTKNLKMPPKGRLPEKAIVALTEWVSRGAVWGASSANKGLSSIATARSNHWAFQPLKSPAVPVAKDPGRRATSQIDQFVLAQLEAAGLKLAPPADRATLIRRASFDLVGLPPAPQRVMAFLSDPRPTTVVFAELVDELLNSPHYGERWGRYWLDVARYADNKGYVFFEEQAFPWSYTYRDWVIRSLNEDLPFDQFVKAQLAADQLPEQQRDRHLAALGFITIGGHFVNNVHDIIDDRIDVVTRGLQGLTVTCARCHDHKFDPISQADYYALYGVFRSSTEPMVLPRIPAPIPETEEFEFFEQELARKQERLSAFLNQKHQELVSGARTRFADYLMSAHSSLDQPSTEEFMLLIPEGDLHPLVVQRYWLSLRQTKRNGDRVWRAWHALAEIPEAEFTTQAPIVLSKLAENKEGATTGTAPTISGPIHPRVFSALQSPPVTSLKETAERLGKLLLDVDSQWQALCNEARTQRQPIPERLPDPLNEELRLVFYADDAPANVPMTNGWGVLTLLPDRAAQGQYQQLLNDLQSWMPRDPKRMPRAMVLQDEASPYQPRIFLRGNPNRAGETIPRRFLEVLASDMKPFATGSGRRELAEAIASADNPLTARVFVNRVWKNHFGAGLVLTPSDFGVRSDPPSHPELLTWLSRRFIESGWSIKQLHRELMNSATYQQSSTADPSLGSLPAQVDSENRLLWRFNRRRHDFETLRDALLWSAGTLDKSAGGPSVNLLSGATRRSVYGFIDRLSLPGLLRTFDFPSPDNSSPGRDQTTVAPQALYLMNGSFAEQCAEKLVQRTEVTSASTLDDRVTALFQLVFARAPLQDELDHARSFFGNDSTPATDPETWRNYGHALLLTNEFAFVD